ncbi:MAG: rhomboid family intramembrane serine protease [bacterium]
MGARSSSFGPPLTPAIKWLMIANGGVFLLQLTTGMSWMNQWLGLVPRAILTDLAIWQIGTYMFLHGSFLHIAMNMFFLWMFGADLERQWGSREFLKYYFLTGIGAGIFTFLININSTIPTIGASGAIFAVLIAFGMVFPNRIILLWFIIPIKAKYMVIGAIALSMWALYSGNQPGVAHWTHLAGALIGFLYLKQDWHLPSILRPFRRFSSKRKTKAKLKENREQAELMSEVDRILDRINELGGYEHLSEKEKKTLEKASQQLSNKRN